MKSWIAFVFGSLIVIFHWTMVAFHVGPYTPLSAAVWPIQAAYLEPIFSQSWQLFAPTPPTTSLSLAYQCELKNHEWSAIKEPANELLYKHYKYRVSYHGKLLSVVESLARNLNNERVDIVKQAKCSENSKSECMAKVFKNQSQSEGYLLTQRFVKDACTSEFGTFLSQKIYVIARFVTPFSKKNINNEPHIEFMNFTL